MYADLNNAGLALRAAGEVGMVTRQLNVLWNPDEYIPGQSPTGPACSNASGWEAGAGVTNGSTLMMRIPNNPTSFDLVCMAQWPWVL
jgi:hypothetical protein